MLSMEPIEARSDARRKRIPAGVADVYAALCDAARVARWWGPDGFKNSIHEFDFRPGGAWKLTMHGPDGRDYPNESRFVRIITNQLVQIEHLSAPHFLLSIELHEQGGDTLVAWQQTFDTVEHFERISAFIAAANEQNLERLFNEVQGLPNITRTS